MWRVTVYDSGNDKSVQESDDWDEIEDLAGLALKDMAKGTILSYVVSKIGGGKGKLKYVKER